MVRKNQGILSKKASTQLLTREVFDRAIAGLEAAKREDFSKETLDTWFNIMSNREWTNGFFVEKVRCVLDSKQYGGVKFDSFIEGRGFYTVYEANQIALNIIEKRKLEMRSMQIPIEKIEEQGMIDIRQIYEGRIRIAMDKFRELQIKKVKSVEKFIRCASEDTKRKIADILKGKGYLDPDKEPHWKAILHLFAPQVIQEVEEIMMKGG